MTSFLWIHIAHNVANACLQPCSRLKEPSIRELLNASSDDTTRRATPAACHASCTIGHVKNKCGQSSSSPTHSGQHTSAPGTMRWRMTLVIRRRRKSSQPKIRIFSGIRCFHTTRQRRTRVAASGASYPRRRRYASLVENLVWRHIQASGVPASGLRLAKQICKDVKSANLWLDNAWGRIGVQVPVHIVRSMAGGSSARA